MKKFIPIHIALLTFVSTSLALAYTVQTFSPKTNIRSSSKATAPKVTDVKSGTKLRVLARNNQTEKEKLWLKVETDQGQVGWVKASVTKLVKDSVEALPASINSYEAPAASSAPAPMDTELPTPEASPSPSPTPSGMDTEVPDIEILDSLE